MHIHMHAVTPRTTQSPVLVGKELPLRTCLCDSFWGGEKQKPFSSPLKVSGNLFSIDGTILETPRSPALCSDACPFQIQPRVRKSVKKILWFYLLSRLSLQAGLAGLLDSEEPNSMTYLPGARPHDAPHLIPLEQPLHLSFPGCLFHCRPGEDEKAQRI